MSNIMNQYTTFHKVLDYLQYFQEQSPMLNTFGYGNLVDFGKNISGSSVNYPFLFVVPQSIEYQENMTVYSLTMIFADILNWDLSNEKDCVSDMSLEARRFLSYVKRGMNTLPEIYDNIDINLPASALPFFERFGDHVAGVALEVPLIVYDTIDACDYYPTPTITPSLSPTPSITPSPTETQVLTPTPTSTPTNTATPTITPTSTSVPTTPTATPTHTPTPTSGLLTFLAFSGESQYLSCNSGTSVTVYAQDLGNCGGCSPLTCWACLSTSQFVYSDPGLTQLVTDGWYTNYMTPPSSNPGIWRIYDGKPQGGGFTGGCPPSPSPTPSSPANHPFSFTGYVSDDSYCEAYSGTNRTFVTLYGDQSCFDNNVVFFDSASGGNSTNLYGNYAVMSGCAGFPIGAILDYDGRVQTFTLISISC